MNILFPRLNNGYIPLLLCFIAFLAGISGSLQAPFYPKEAKAKGLNKIHVGLIFGTYHFIIFLTSPFFGKKVKNIGAKKMIYTGVIIMGSAGICFGLLEFIQNKTLFTILSYVIRGIEALGHSSFKTATFTIVANEYPDMVGSLFSFLQASFGAGLTLGPFFGGVLYNMGGFCLPFTFSRNYFEYKQSMTNILRFNNVWSIDEIVSVQHICLKNVHNKYEIGS